MTDQEIINKLQTLQRDRAKELDKVRQDFDLRQQAIMNEWAAEHARFKIGDILQMGCFTIRVEKIVGQNMSYGNRLYVAYYGPTVTKKFQPTKDGYKTYVYDDGRVINKLNK